MLPIPNAGGSAYESLVAALEEASSAANCGVVKVSRSPIACFSWVGDSEAKFECYVHLKEWNYRGGSKKRPIHILLHKAAATSPMNANMSSTGLPISSMAPATKMSITAVARMPAAAPKSTVLDAPIFTVPSLDRPACGAASTPAAFHFSSGRNSLPSIDSGPQLAASSFLSARGHGAAGSSPCPVSGQGPPRSSSFFRFSKSASTSTV